MHKLTQRQRQALRRALAERRRDQGGRVTAEQHKARYTAAVLKRRTFKPPMPTTNVADDLLVDDNLI